MLMNSSFKQHCFIFLAISTKWWANLWPLIWFRKWMFKLPMINSKRLRGPLWSWYTTTYTTSAYQHSICEFKSRSRWAVLDMILCDKVCQWAVTGRWCSTGTPVSFTNKTHHNNIAEILWKVTLSTITLALKWSNPNKCTFLFVSFTKIRCIMYNIQEYSVLYHYHYYISIFMFITRTLFARLFVSVGMGSFVPIKLA